MEECYGLNTTINYDCNNIHVHVHVHNIHKNKGQNIILRIQ